MTNKSELLLEEFSVAFEHATGLVLSHRQLEVPFDSHGAKRRLDARFSLKIPHGKQYEIALEALADAYPRNVRFASEHLAAYNHSRKKDDAAIPFVIAEHLSPGSRAFLRGHGINYYDASGTLYFHHLTWLIDVEKAPKSRPPRRPTALFSGAREQVIHAALMHWHTNQDNPFISGADLAALAATSTYTVSETMQELERQDWIESVGKGPTQRRRLRAPAGLLDAWAAAWQQRRETVTRCYAYAPPPGGIVDTMIERLAGRHDWAITGAAAANTVLPYLTRVDRVEIMVPPGMSQVWANDLKLSQAEKGSNVILIERKGASLMFLDEHPARKDSRYASPFIQYLDLLDNYGRNKELANEYRRRVLDLGDKDD
jgi:hypothetical protein